MGTRGDERQGESNLNAAEKMRENDDLVCRCYGERKRKRIKTLKHGLVVLKRYDSERERHRQ